ncbi:MAG: hypothetical protein ACOC95_06935 [Planctomycetota bacterium]
MRRRTPMRLGVALAAVAVVSLAAVSIRAGEEKAASPSDDNGRACGMRARGTRGAAVKTAAHRGGKHHDGACPKDDACPKKEACGRKEACTAHCKHLDQTLADLDAAVAGAVEALEAGNTDEALAKLNEAEALLAGSREHLKTACPKKEAPCPKAADDGRPVNGRCPMMGSRIDPDKVPDRLTRRFEGKTIGFCCAGCPTAWDKLTDEQRREKLRQTD